MGVFSGGDSDSDLSSTTVYKSGGGQLCTDVESNGHDVSLEDDSDAGTLVPAWERQSLALSRHWSSQTLDDNGLTSQLQKSDRNYFRSSEEWTFRKVAGAPASVAVRAGRPIKHEFWRHQLVGQFKVEKQWTERKHGLAWWASRIQRLTRYL